MLIVPDFHKFAKRAYKAVGDRQFYASCHIATSSFLVGGSSNVFSVTSLEGME